MLLDLQEAETLSQRYHVPKEDIILIDLNLSGMKTDTSYKRLRFWLTLDSKPKETLCFGIPVLSKSDTKFYLAAKEGILSFDHERIGSVAKVENDTCDTSYFRRSGTSLNLNSNSRSSCAGCLFCATHRQDATDKEPLDTDQKIAHYMENLVLRDNDIIESHREDGCLDFSNLYQIGIVTGCFGSEERAVNHIKMINRYFSARGFDGEIFYIGSEIISEQALRDLKKSVKKFALCLSLELFMRRNVFLKKIKSNLTLDSAKDVMKICKKLKVPVTFTYIVGLDCISDIDLEMPKFASLATRFPVFQIFQPHYEEQKRLRVAEAENIEYYLKVRRSIELMLKPKKIRPQSWQNYRSLWYFLFADEPLAGIRI